MMLCVQVAVRVGRKTKKHMSRRTDIVDVLITVLVSPFIWLLVTRAPVLATFIFSSVLITT
jgi:hypothetical protein